MLESKANEAERRAVLRTHWLWCTTERIKMCLMINFGYLIDVTGDLPYGYGEFDNDIYVGF